MADEVGPVFEAGGDRDIPGVVEVEEFLGRLVDTGGCAIVGDYASFFCEGRGRLVVSLKVKGGLELFRDCSETREWQRY